MCGPLFPQCCGRRGHPDAPLHLGSGPPEAVKCTRGCGRGVDEPLAEPQRCQPPLLPGKPRERGHALPVLKCRAKIYHFPKLPHICQFMQEFKNYLRFFLKKHFFSLSFFSKETKPSMAGYEIWIIYLQTGHKSDPVLEVNAYLVFKAYCLSM